MQNIDQIGQKKLGDVIHGYGQPHWNPGCQLEVGVTSVDSESDELDLNTRGIFIYDPKSYAPGQRDQDILIYGFTRTGKWMKACVSFQLGRDRNTVEDNKHVYLCFETVHGLLQSYDFLRLVRIFDALDEVIDRYVENRRRLQREAEELQRDCEMEAELLGHFVDRNEQIPYRGEFQLNDVVEFDDSRTFVPKGKVDQKNP